MKSQRVVLAGGSGFLGRALAGFRNSSLTGKTVSWNPSATSLPKPDA